MAKGGFPGDRLKFTFFFIALVIGCGWQLGGGASMARWLWLWPALSSSQMALAYGCGRPGWVMGKQRHGGFSMCLLLTGLPWLLVTWIGFRVQRALTSEKACNEIPGTHISIGCYPDRALAREFDLIIDLTCEFPASGAGAPQRYLCFPNLDGVALSEIPADLSLTREQKVLIHCAQGHGRSAILLALLLARSGLTATPGQGFEQIQAVRPLARPKRSQRQQLY